MDDEVKVSLCITAAQLSVTFASNPIDATDSFDGSDPNTLLGCSTPPAAQQP